MVSQGKTSLTSAVRPYLQFVEAGKECEQTGLLLTDIWRYFRHTWTNPHKSIPGRSMMMLVRDGAAPYHSVMGIAALSSAAIKLRARDEFLGWEPSVVIKELTERPTKKAAIWLLSAVKDRLDELFTGDLIEDGLLNPDHLRRPSLEVIDRLQNESQQSNKQHQRLKEKQEYKSRLSKLQGQEDNKEWERYSRMPLFRSKRCTELAALLECLRVLDFHFGPSPSRSGLAALLRDKRGQKSIVYIVRALTAKMVGTAIGDLTVCGAVPPYNSLLVGKLVGMLSVSPEVVLEYRRRYGATSSLIASCMAGRSISRPASLVFVGTTSLYGERPCQYDRISIPG